MDFDRLLGLDLLAKPAIEAPGREVEELLREREALRRERSYEEADSIRERVREMGYEVRDMGETTKALPAPRWAKAASIISSSDGVASLLGRADEVEFTISIAARQGCVELDRCLSSALEGAGGVSAELIVLDNGLEGTCAAHFDDVAREDGRGRVFHADHFLGAAGRSGRGRGISNGLQTRFAERDRAAG